MAHRNERTTGRDEPVFRWLGLGEPGVVVLTVLLVTVLGSGLAVVHTTYQYRTLFNEHQELRQQGNMLEVEWGQLLIEHSTFGLEGRIERKAADELQMKLPEWSRIIMVQYDAE
ncbi:MAG: cell division protein FtsL [Pseudohongiellaceae bacterium]